MKPTTYFVALLIGSQIGVSDVLLFPTLVAEHGAASFILVFALFKLMLVGPLMQAEIMAAQHATLGVSPMGMPPLWPAAFSPLFKIAIAIALILTLFNAAWTLGLALDAITDYAANRSANQALHWLGQSQNVTRISFLVALFATLLLACLQLSLRNISKLYLGYIALMSILTVAAAIHLWSMPPKLLWTALSWPNVSAALHYALSSSLVGFMLWFTLARKLSPAVSGFRLMMVVQAVDLLFSMSILPFARSWLVQPQSSTMSTALAPQPMLQIAETGHLALSTAVPWLLVLGSIGAISLIPFVILAAELQQTKQRYITAMLLLSIAVFSSIILVISHSDHSPLTWYGKTFYQFLHQFSYGLVFPLAAVWVIFRFVVFTLSHSDRNLRGLKKIVTRIVPQLACSVLLGAPLLIVAMQSLSELTLLEPITLLALACAALLLLRLFVWVKKRAIFPEL